MVITFGITAVLASVGRDDSPADPAVISPTATVAAPTAAATIEPTTPEPEPTEVGSATEPEPTDQPTESDDPATVTVQVLDTVGGGTGADAVAAADALREMGYDVVAVNSTPRTVSTTTILFTAGNRDEARALMDADDRFPVLANNDGFSEDVDLHVLVAEGFAD